MLTGIKRNGENQMSRLNNSIREKIIANAIEKSGVLSRQEELDKRRADLAEHLRIKAIGGELEDKIYEDTIKKIDAYLEKNKHKHIDTSVYPIANDDELYVNFAGMSVNLYFHGGENRKDHKHINKYTGDNDYHKRLVITTSDEEYATLDKIMKEQKAISDIKEAVISKTRAVVNSVTTIKKLVEVWPESLELIPKIERPVSTALVANVESLNAAIGLPSE